MSEGLEKLALIQKVFEKLAEWNAYDLARLDKDYETNFDLDFLEIEAALKDREQYKAIEQGLGIDLIKLLNAKKVYYMGWNINNDALEIQETYKLFINLTDRTIEYYEDEYSEFTYDLELKNYGKNDIYGGWAFTREELK